jgi:serine/threonine protein kinase
MELAAELSPRVTGERIGRYEVIRRIAVGGMAEIFLARSTGIEGFEKRVIVKRILPHLAENPDFVAMFLDEARLAATLHHANIAQVYDIGAEDGSYFFALEYIEGKDVRHLRIQLARRQLELPHQHAIAIVLGVAAGLHAAHERRGHDGRPLNMVHRDVSPSNVIVTFDGGVKLIDFGIAKAAQRQTHTRTGVLKGKSAYMSPEQWLGEPVDRRSDVFALGILLYELTTGERLFKKGAEYEIMRQFIKGKTALTGRFPPYFPVELERIVARALSRHPGDRYPSAQAFYQDLERFALDERLQTSPFGLADWLRTVFPDDAFPADARPAPFIGPDSGPAVQRAPTPTPTPTPTGPRARTLRGGVEVSTAELTSGELESSDADISVPEITLGTVHVCDGVDVKFTERAEIAGSGRAGSETTTITLPRTRVDVPATRVDVPPTRIYQLPSELRRSGRSWLHAAVVTAAVAVAGGAAWWALGGRGPIPSPEGDAPATLALEPTGLPMLLARDSATALGPIDADIPDAVASTDWRAEAPKRIARPRPKPAAPSTDTSATTADAATSAATTPTTASPADAKPIDAPPPAPKPESVAPPPGTAATP